MSALFFSSIFEVFLETFSYGVYFVLFTAVIYLSFTRNRISPQKRPALWVLLGLIFQFLTITAHWIDGMNEIYYTVVHLGGGPAADAFYSDLSTASSIIHITLFIICSLVTDLLVIHRLYIICAHERSVVVFPLAVLVAEAVSGSSVIVHFKNWVRAKNSRLSCSPCRMLP